MLHRMITLLCLPAFVLSLAFATGCSEQAEESDPAGALGDAAEQARNTAEEAAEETGDAVEDAADEAEEATDSY